MSPAPARPISLPTADLVTPSPPPDWSAFGEQEGAWLGYSLATAGDVNGGSFDDVIVGIPDRTYPPTPTPTATPRSTPTATATPMVAPVYLPLILHH
jgi:hypothetical protein